MTSRLASRIGCALPPSKELPSLRAQSSWSDQEAGSVRKKTEDRRGRALIFRILGHPSEILLFSPSLPWPRPSFELCILCKEDISYLKLALRRCGMKTYLPAPKTQVLLKWLRLLESCLGLSPCPIRTYRKWSWR